MSDLKLLAALELVATHAAGNGRLHDSSVREWCEQEARTIRAERDRMVRLARALLEDTIGLNHASDDEMHEFAIRARRLVHEFDIIDAQVIDDDDEGDGRG